MFLEYDFSFWKEKTHQTMTNLLDSRWSYLLFRLNVYSLCNIMLDKSRRAAFAWAVFVTVSICELPTAIIRTTCCRWLWFLLLWFWKMPPIMQRWPNWSSNALSLPALTLSLSFKQDNEKAVIKKKIMIHWSMWAWPREFTGWDICVSRLAAEPNLLIPLFSILNP